MSLCSEHLYQIDKGITSRQEVNEKILLYRSGNRCLCCKWPYRLNDQDLHKNCCSIEKINAREIGRFYDYTPYSY